MNAITFDTLDSARRLEASGVAQKQAEAIAKEMRAAHDASRDDLVTVSVFESGLALTTSQLEVRLAETKAEILKWMIPLQLGQYALIIGILIKISG